MGFLKEARARFPDKLVAIANSQPEVASFVQTL